MNRQWLLLVLSLALLILQGCKNEKEKQNYVFPLQIGNHWMMIHEAIGIDESDTGYTDTLNMWVDQTEISPSNEPCYRLKYLYSGIDRDDYGYEYLVNRTDGLYLLGYSGGGSGYMPLKKGSVKMLNPGVFSRQYPKSDSKEITWLTTPRLIIPRDCSEGKSWGYPETDEFGLINYCMEAKQTVMTGCGEFSSHTRKAAVWGDDPDGWSYYDYYSNVGLSKFRYEDLYEQTNVNGDLIGTVLVVEQLLLESYELN